MGIVIEYKDAENKLLLLYLINMMDMPMSRAQITDFILKKDLMHTFVLEQNLTDLVERKFLETSRESSQDESVTRYAITEEGAENLDFLENQIPRPVRNMIAKYVEENRGKIKKDFEKTCNYFPSDENEDEYIVKCGVYDDKRGSMLMELAVPVLTRGQAKLIQANWNANYTALYQRILAVLTDG